MFTRRSEASLLSLSGRKVTSHTTGIGYANPSPSMDHNGVRQILQRKSKYAAPTSFPQRNSIALESCANRALCGRICNLMMLNQKIPQFPRHPSRVLLAVGQDEMLYRRRGLMQTAHRAAQLPHTCDRRSPYRRTRSWRKRASGRSTSSTSSWFVGGLAGRLV